jgi:hypothetical protein
MSILKDSLQVDENLNRLLAVRKLDDFDWQLAEYSKYLEVSSKDLEAFDLEVAVNFDINFRTPSWKTSALVAAMFLAQQQLNGVAAEPTNNLYNYSGCVLGTEKLNSSGRIQFPQIDTTPIDLDEKLKTEAADKVELETIFNGLAKKWKDETKGQSSVSRIVMHPSYLSIIGLGKEALPMILKDLKNEPNHWFTALRAISKVESSPVRPEDAGNIKKMTEAWLRWGKDNGYLE